MNKTNESLLREALALYEKYGSWVKASPHATKQDGSVGLDSAAFGRRLSKAKQHFNIKDKPPVEGKDVHIDSSEKLIKAATEEVLRRELNATRASLKNSLETFEYHRRVWEELTGFAQRQPNVPDWMLTQSPPGTPGTPVAVWSDWHWGEEVVSTEVRGLNSFNKAIAHKRIKTLVEKIIELCFDHMKNPTYDRLVLCIGGDMITGIIHEELQDTNYEYILETLLDLEDKLIWAIDRLLEKFPAIAVYCVVGNHGRMGKKPRYKGKVKTNFEWGLYKKLEAYYRGNEKIKFFIPDAADIHFTVNGVRFLLTHGDNLGVKGGDGIIGAIGPIIRGMVKIGRAEARVKQDFDILIIGHWHQYTPLAHLGVIVNGSMKGYDEFAMLAIRAAFQLPIQSLFFVHPTYGVTTQWPIFLEKEK